MTRRATFPGALPDWVRAANAGGRLGLAECYLTIQGETTFVGRPCVMVRLTGCPLRCVWCDTRHAYASGCVISEAELCAAVRALDCPLVSVTGGEPLAQPPALGLLQRLAADGHTVLLETSGAVSTAAVDPRVHCIVDLKPPDSGMTRWMCFDNLERLRPHDEVKFVLASARDYAWARRMLRRFDLAQRCAVLFSAAWPQLESRVLADWILADRLPVRLQVPLQRTLWGSDTRGR